MTTALATTVTIRGIRLEAEEDVKDGEMDSLITIVSSGYGCVSRDLVSDSIESRVCTRDQWQHLSRHTTKLATSYTLYNMSAEEEQTQDGYEDGAAGGPGAPMPLSTLEVSTQQTPFKSKTHV